MFGGGDQVGANVVLGADTSGYNSAMQGSVQETNRLAQAYDSLKAKIDRGFKHVEHVSFGVSAADIASLTAATAAAGRLQGQMQQLSAQSAVLNRTYGDGRARMTEYSRAVDSVRSSFGEATSSAAQLVKTIAGFERGGSTQGLTQLAQNFERMSQTTGENASALAQSVLTLEQTMGTGLRSTKEYSDQLVSMAEASNTSASSLANFASQIAPLGRQLNMTQSQITGFAAAFSKAGQDGYRASNVFSQMTSDIAQSLQSNSPRLAAYANLLGVTTQALKGMSGAAVTAGLFDAIGRGGSGSLQTLNRLGYDGLNVTRVVSAVTQQSGGVGNYLRMANSTYGDGAASAGGQTAGQQFSKLKEDLQQSGEAIGQHFLPALQSVMTMVDKFALATTRFMQGPGGDMVTVFAALLAPVAALAGGLVSLHGAILPLMTLMALRRSSLGTGIAEGFRYGGRGPVGNAMYADPRMAERPVVGKAYGAGQRIGMFGRMGGSGDRLSPRMRWVLGADKLAAAEGGAATTMAAEEAAVMGPGLFARGGGRVAGFLHRNVVVPQFDPLRYKNPLDRMPFVGNAFGGGAKGAESLAAAETGAAEAATGFKVRLTTMSAAAQEWTASLSKSMAALVPTTDALAKAQADAAATTATSSAKVGESMGAAAVATEEAAGAIQTASATIMGAARASMAAAGGGMLGMAKGVGAGAMAAGGIGMRGVGAGLGAAGGAMLGMGPMGWGMLALMGAPLLNSGMNKAFGTNTGTMGPGASDIPGTGLSFPLANVVAPIASGASIGAAFNPMHPNPAQMYAATQASDYTNQGIKNIKTADEAVAIYGPAFAQMAAGDQASLAKDLIKRLGPGGYTQFTNLLQSGKYSSYGAKNAAAVGGKGGGLAALYNTQSQIGQGYTNQAGSDFRALDKTYLSANLKPGETRPFDILQNPFNRRASSMDTTGFTGGGRFSTGLGYMNVSHSDWHGFLPYGSKKTYGLTGQGLDFARSLYGGDPGKEAQTHLGQVLYGKPNADMEYVLKHIPKADLNTALQAHGLAPTNDRKTDVAAVMDAMKTASKSLTSALHGLGLSNLQQHELANEDASNPGYYGQKLYGAGIGQRRLSQLYLQGGSMFPGTIDAVQAYGANQLSMLSPFMTAQQQILGSSSGARGVSGMNAGMINTDMGGFNGQFSLLGTAQGQLRTGRALEASGQLSGDAKAMGNLQTASNNLEQAYTQQLQTMKQYEMTLDSMNFSSKEFKQSMAWQAEQQKLMVSREKEDQRRQVGREEYSYTLQRKRGEADFQRSRHRAEADYNLSRTRALEDFTHQTTMMIKQSALSMHDIYSQSPSQGFTSAQFLLYNNAQQTTSMHRQEGQLSTLRGMGLGSDAIQQLGLTGANNAQELNGLFAQIQQNPALIDQLNSAVTQRLTAAGALATDASSMSYQEQVHSFQLSLDRGAEDFTKSMKRAHDDFDLQMNRSATDFARQMGLQDKDFQRQLARQQKDYNTSVSHSWTSFNDQVTQSLHQMNLAAAPLTDTAKTLNTVAKQLAGSNVGDTAAALAKAYPQVTAVIKGLATLLNPNQTLSGKNEPYFLKLLDILNSKGKFFMGAGGGGGSVPVGGAGGGLPKGIAERMAADHPHSGWCLKDVADVLAAPHGASTAYKAWLGAKGHRYSMNSLIPPPIGAPIFFGPSYGGGDGHIAINAGGGMMWSEDSGNQWQKKRIWPGVLGWSSTLNGGTVASNYGMQGFAKGSWDLPIDMIAQIHKGEMIIPAKVAEAVRGVVSKSQVASMSTHAAPVYNHVDARHYSTSEETTFSGPINIHGVANPRQLAEDAKAQARFKALAKR